MILFSYSESDPLEKLENATTPASTSKGNSLIGILSGGILFLATIYHPLLESFSYIRLNLEFSSHYI